MGEVAEKLLGKRRRRTEGVMRVLGKWAINISIITPFSILFPVFHFWRWHLLKAIPIRHKYAYISLDSRLFFIVSPSLPLPPLPPPPLNPSPPPPPHPHPPNQIGPYFMLLFCTSQPGLRPSQPGPRIRQPGLQPSQPGIPPSQPGPTCQASGQASQD